MASTPQKKPSIKGLVKAFLIANPLATNAQVIKATGCSSSLPTMARNELRAAGFHVRARFDQTTPGITGMPGSFQQELITATEGTPDATATPMRGTAEVIDLLESAKTSDKELTAEEQRTFLSKLARDKNEPPQIRMAAMTMYNKLVSDDTDERDALGPGKPKTRADRVTRLSLLMRACGPTESLDAYKMAFNVEEESEEAMDTGNDAAQAEGPATAEGHTSALPADGQDHGASGLGSGDSPVEPTNPS